MPDGMLLHLRDTYPVETAWAPPWVGDQLRQVRRGAGDARLAAIRAAAEARAARGRRDAAARHEALAASYRAMEAAYRERENVLAGVMDDRREWEQVTAGRRRLAVAADAELRRRHPGQELAPLRSAEPALPPEADNAGLNLAPDRDNPGADRWIAELGERRHAFALQLAERKRLAASPEDSGRRGDARYLSGWGGFSPDALLQPPRPEIRPSARVLERARERQAGMEAMS